VVVIVAVLALAFVAAQTCQRAQVRVSEERAVATAKRAVDFRPRRTVVRFLRQGLQSRPYWVVSLSIPGPEENTFRRLAVVRVDANTGRVEDVGREDPGR